MSVLSERLKQPDMVGLSDAQAANALNAPDPSLPPVMVAFSCREIAEPAVLSGELEMLRIVARLGHIPADVSPTGENIPVPTQGLTAIGTMIDAVHRDLRVDPATAGGQIAAMLGGIEAMGLLSPATKAAILSKTVRAPSWAEANGLTVDVFAVAAARAGAQAVTVLGWLSNGPAPGGGVHEQVRLQLPDQSEVAPIFNLPMAGNATLRAAALNVWLSNNAHVLS
jgi:hypothetical protein